MKALNKKRFVNIISRPVVTGLFVILPLVITIVVIVWLADLLSSILGPESGFGSLLQSIGLNFVDNHIIAYILGLAGTFVLIYILGVLVQIGLQKQFDYIIDNILNRIPIINIIYKTSKKFSSMFEVKDHKELTAMRPVMCHFGDKNGASVLALLTSKEMIEINGIKNYSVMIPTSPVPIGGAILYVPEKMISKVDIGIDKLLNIYASMGVSGNEYFNKK